MLEEMDFEGKMKTMTDRALIEFIARQSYETCQAVDAHNKRIEAIEGRDRRAYGLAGLAGGVVSGIGYFIQLWTQK